MFCEKNQTELSGTVLYKSAVEYFHADGTIRADPSPNDLNNHISTKQFSFYCFLISQRLELFYIKNYECIN